MEFLLEANVLWSTDDELNLKTEFDHIAAQFSGVPPIHNHQGYLVLTEDFIHIDGDRELNILLSDIVEIYRGFDEFYRPNFVKNLGAFCQPLRIKYTKNYSYHVLYLIVGYNFFGCAKGKMLFNSLQELLS